MWRPGSHSKAHHPPEAGRSNGPGTQMGDARRPQCGKKASQLETESVGPGVDGELELRLSEGRVGVFSRWALRDTGK